MWVFVASSPTCCPSYCTPLHDALSGIRLVDGAFMGATLGDLPLAMHWVIAKNFIWIKFNLFYKWLFGWHPKAIESSIESSHDQIHT